MESSGHTRLPPNTEDPGLHLRMLPIGDSDGENQIPEVAFHTKPAIFNIDTRAHTQTRTCMNTQTHTGFVQLSSKGL